LYRSAVTKLLTPHGERLRTRIIAVDSFYFHLVLPASSLTTLEFEQAAEELGAYVQGLVALSPTLPEVTLRTSPQDAISSIVPHIQANRDTYRDFFRRPKS
jgi:hypothetical protein